MVDVRPPLHSTSLCCLTPGQTYYVLCQAKPFHAVSCHITTQHSTSQHNTTQHNTTQHNTTQHNTTQHNTTQHNTTQHNTTQHNTTQHNTTQHNTTQHILLLPISCLTTYSNNQELTSIGRCAAWISCNPFGRGAQGFANVAEGKRKLVTVFAPGQRVLGNVIKCCCILVSSSMCKWT